jgi:hypothetical protein
MLFPLMSLRRFVLGILALTTVGAVTARGQQNNARVPMVSTVDDTGQHLRSDGRGPYVDGVDSVNTVDLGYYNFTFSITTTHK